MFIGFTVPVFSKSPRRHLLSTPRFLFADRARWEEFIAPFHILASSADVAWEYGRAYRYLQGNRLLIGANDLWIAATGIAYRMPIVTRNVEHYRRVPDLQVATYRL